MEPIAEYSVTAHPDYRLVEVYDADACLVDSAAAQASQERVVAGNGYHLYLHSPQSGIPVRVTIRIWPAPRRPPEQAEGSVPVSLESETATLIVGQLTMGPAGEMRLPRPGVYEGHAWWTGRRATAAYYEETLERADGEDAAGQLTEAWSRCPVEERYVLDLVFAGPPVPVEEDDEW
ncbi:hypothetical protein ACLGI4_01595 [Streptomyces sp. HMX112]|uniref:hypothetical protein n=1 Tax=Streptomyces sp. HMX112 TaxID=3390850 RepID=UPI003A801A1F